MTEKQYKKYLEDLMGLYKQKAPNIPARVLDKSNKAIMEVYSTQYKALYKELVNELATDFGVAYKTSHQSQQALLKMIEKRMASIDKQATGVVKDELEKTYIASQLQMVMAQGVIESVEEMMGYIPYSTLSNYKMEQIVADTMEDLLFNTQHTGKELKKVVRDTFSKNIQYHALKGEKMENIRNLIAKELSKEGIGKTVANKGFVGIIDSSGRKWNTQVYVDMAVKTKLNQVYVEGLKDRATETGKDLAMIPRKGATDSCREFEGMIISLTGATKGYYTYDELKATGLIFHPRCQHSPFPIGKLELLDESEIERHKGIMANLGDLSTKRKKSRKK